MRSDSAVPGLSRASVLTSRLPVPRRSSLRELRREVRPLFALRESLAAQSAALATLRDECFPGGLRYPGGFAPL